MHACIGDRTITADQQLLRRGAGAIILPALRRCALLLPPSSDS
jgi:hypothetical protein